MKHGKKYLEAAKAVDRSIQQYFQKSFYRQSRKIRAHVDEESLYSRPDRPIRVRVGKRQ